MAQQYDYAGFWIRFAAWLLDAIFVALMSIIPIIIVFVAIGAGGNDASFFDAGDTDQGRNRDDAAQFASSMVSLLVWAVYQFILTARGASWGKSICNLRIVRVASGAAPGYGVAAVRVGVLAAFSLLLQIPDVLGSDALNLIAIPGLIAVLLNYLWPIWDEDKQTWHDKAAGTVVVRV